jgi:hypothetical protein
MTLVSPLSKVIPIHAGIRCVVLFVVATLAALEVTCDFGTAVEHGFADPGTLQVAFALGAFPAQSLGAMDTAVTHAGSVESELTCQWYNAHMVLNKPPSPQPSQPVRP